MGRTRRGRSAADWRDIVRYCNWVQPLAKAVSYSLVPMILSLFRWGLLVVLGVLLVFYVLTWITKWRNRLTAEQVEKIIERHLNENQGPWDWDDFTSLPIHDDYLEKIRLRCIELDSVPSFDRVPELTRILLELREQKLRKR
jgi:hypothetical protein